MSGLFGKKPDPKEQVLNRAFRICIILISLKVKEWKRKINHEQRTIDRQIRCTLRFSVHTFKILGVYTVFVNNPFVVGAVYYGGLFAGYLTS